MKKKVLFYVILLASLNVLPASVLAKNILSFSLYTGIEFVASSTEIPSPPPSPETEGTGISLAIDHDNKYSGMDKSYRDGYVPSIKEGCAVILLPLMADGDLVGNALTVTPQLGEPASSPFVFKNYQMTVIKDNHSVNDDASLKASYLISLQLPLKADRINGVYQISIDVRGKGKADGSEVSQSFPTYVIISDGTPPASGEPPEEIPSSQPKVIVNSHSLHPLPVIAGQEFTLSVTLKNTSNMKSIQNMTVDVSCDATNFILLNDSSTIFIGSLGRGATKELLLRYRTDLETPAQQYSIALALSYEDLNASPLTSSGTVPVTVQQSLNVQMEKPQIAPLVKQETPCSFHPCDESGTKSGI